MAPSSRHYSVITLSDSNTIKGLALDRDTSRRCRARDRERYSKVFHQLFQGTRMWEEIRIPLLRNTVWQ